MKNHSHGNGRAKDSALNRTLSPATGLLVAFAFAFATVGLSGPGFASVAPMAQDSTSPITINAWVPQRPNVKPIVAIIGENGGTELADFVIPYGVLKRAGIETVALTAREGPLRFRPALQPKFDATLAEFDVQNPEGADYVVVPAMVRAHAT